MRLFLKVNILFLLAFLPFSALANDYNTQKYWKNVEKRMDRVSPYLQGGKIPHNSQWYGTEWYAEDWLVQYDRDLDLIDGFYKADIFREQTMDSETPVLVVGPNFYRLSGFDQRRVTHVLDVVYNITEGSSAQSFVLKDWHSNKQIGYYSAHGLIIQ